MKPTNSKAPAQSQQPQEHVYVLTVPCGMPRAGTDTGSSSQEQGSQRVVHLQGVVECPAAGVALGVWSHATPCTGVCEIEVDLDLAHLIATSTGMPQDTLRDGAAVQPRVVTALGTASPYAAGSLLVLQAGSGSEASSPHSTAEPAAEGSASDTPVAAQARQGEASTSTNLESSADVSTTAPAAPGAQHAGPEEHASWFHVIMSQRACLPPDDSKPATCISWVALCGISLMAGASLSWLLLAACGMVHVGRSPHGPRPGPMTRPAVAPAPLGAAFSAGLNQLGDQTQQQQHQQQRGGGMGAQPYGAATLGSSHLGAGNLPPTTGGAAAQAARAAATAVAGAVATTANTLRASGGALLARARASGRAALGAAAGAGSSHFHRHDRGQADEGGPEGEGQGGFWARDENGRLKRFSGAAAWRAAGGIGEAVGAAGAGGTPVPAPGARAGPGAGPGAGDNGLAALFNVAAPKIKSLYD